MKDNRTEYEKAIDRITEVLRSQHEEAVQRANAVLGDSKYGKVAEAQRDYKAEAMALFDRKFNAHIAQAVVDDLCNFGMAANQPRPAIAGVGAPPPPRS